MQHTLQSETRLLHSVSSLGVAVNTDPNIRGLHTADDRRDSHNCQPLGSCCDKLCEVDWIYRDGLVLSGSGHLPARILHRGNWRATLPAPV